MNDTLQERIDYVRQRWHSLCPDYCPLETEVQEWLAKYRMNFVLHGIKVALLESTKAVHRNEAPYSEDEALHRAEQVMQAEQEGFELRRSQN